MNKDCYPCANRTTAVCPLYAKSTLMGPLSLTNRKHRTAALVLCLLYAPYFLLRIKIRFDRAATTRAKWTLRARSHEPGTVNYPGVMIAPGQALPRVHMIICCPGATLPRVNFIAPGQVHHHLIATNLS